MSGSNKQIAPLGNGVNFEKKYSSQDALLKDMLSVACPKRYVMTVTRTSFVHRDNQNVHLTLDKVFFESNIDGYLVFSIFGSVCSCDLETIIPTEREDDIIFTGSYNSCRSKIIEYLFLLEKADISHVYSYLVAAHQCVQESEYHPTPVAEFEQQIALWQQDEHLKACMLRFNETAAEYKYSDAMIEDRYRYALEHGTEIVYCNTHGTYSKMKKRSQIKGSKWFGSIQRHLDRIMYSCLTTSDDRLIPKNFQLLSFV